MTDIKPADLDEHLRSSEHVSFAEVFRDQNEQYGESKCMIEEIHDGKLVRSLNDDGHALGRLNDDVTILNVKRKREEDHGEDHGEVRPAKIPKPDVQVSKLFILVSV